MFAILRRMYIIFTGNICRFYPKKMFITFKKLMLMFAIITGMYTSQLQIMSVFITVMHITITGNVCNYYEECISHLKIMFAIITGMYITFKRNICHYYRNVCHNYR